MRLVSKILVTLGIFAGVVSSVTLTSCDPQEEAHTHTFAEEWTSDDTHHWHEATCEHSGERDSYAEHTWDSGEVTTPEGCETDGVMIYTCTTCDATKTETINATGHSYSEEWTTNETYHWHEATCEHSDEISGKAEHSYNADGVCVCGYRAIPEETLPTTLNELMQEGNEKYQAVVVKTLNDHLLEDMLYKTVGNYNVNSVQIEQWEVVDSDKNGIIDCIKLHFFYDNAIISMLYRISCVEPKTEITLQDLLTENPDAAKLDEAFDRGTPYVNGAKYSTEYAFGYNPTIQQMRKRLLNAVNEKLANDGIISAVGGNTRSFIIRDDEATEDTTLGKAR